MDEKREELLKLIREKSVRFGDFTLSSGKKSSYYIDARLTTLDPKGAYLIGNLILDRLKDSGISADAVGGLSLGADPISTAVSLMSFVRNEPLRALLVRRETKRHGMGRRVEGELTRGDAVIVVEDVISTGGSTLTAIEAIEAEGAHVAAVVGLVDRLMGGKESLEAKGYKVDVIFTIKEILGERWKSPED
ncbi:MAG: orotate phosphoribosyltransferase [Candidatus Glassbacteria bacterium]